MAKLPRAEWSIVTCSLCPHFLIVKKWTPRIDTKWHEKHARQIGHGLCGGTTWQWGELRRLVSEVNRMMRQMP